MHEHADIRRYTLVLDKDPAVATQLTDATGIESRHIERRAAITWMTDEAPAAFFVDQSFLTEDSEDEPIVMRAKGAWPNTPVFVISTGDEGALADALALGADDFVEKPMLRDITAKRVLMRIAALARRAARETLRIGDMTIDTMQRSVSSPKGIKFLSPTEVRLVVELAKAQGSVVHRDTLKNRCWPSTQVSDNALNRKLYEIRRRLKPLSDIINIRTVYGVGFVLEERKVA